MDEGDPPAKLSNTPCHRLRSCKTAHSAKAWMPIWQDHLFKAMVRKFETSMAFFKLLVNRVVELGSQVEI